MNGFYISVSNGLLSKEHKEHMGIAIWEFMWCLDKVTKIDDKGIGWVLGGKPIKLTDVGLGTSEDSVSRNLHKLEQEGYIKLIRTPYGLSIRIHKAKKRFYKNAVSITSGNNAVSLRRSAVSNKTVSVDSNRIDCASETRGDEINEIIDSFKVVNQSFQKFFPNTSQRKSVFRLLEIQDKEKILKVISILPKTNKIPYFPTITTPLQLEDKWSALESALSKKKQELQDKSSNFII